MFWQIILYPNILICTVPFENSIQMGVKEGRISAVLSGFLIAFEFITVFILVSSLYMY